MVTVGVRLRETNVAVLGCWFVRGHPDFAGENAIVGKMATAPVGFSFVIQLGRRSPGRSSQASFVIAA
jgi:hypothetical protein